MCGLTGGVWNAADEAVSVRELRRMTQAVRHRGPDAGGMLVSHRNQTGVWERSLYDPDRDDLPEPHPAGAGCGLGHRRLSIIDLAAGRQPLANEDETIWTVFNGEIYNYRELTADLKRQGHQFRTETDTEVIVHLYEEYGPGFVDRLRGMFALAVWDERRERLVLACDRLGQKPLFYRRTERRLLFASELKSLLQVDDAPRILNREAVDDYLLYQYVPHPECILEGYSKLPPGHRAVHQHGQFTIERYWSPPFADPPPRFDSEEQWSRELRRRLSESVALRLRSDVPLGAFLSGGIDSTIIVGLMQELSENQTKTFSIGFPVEEFDERTYAREAAEHLGTEHFEQVVSPDALSILPRLIWHYDEPFSDSSAIPTMYLSEMTRRHVTVALSGDGGDELFAGYPRYRAVELARRVDKLPRFVKSLLGWKGWQRIPGPTNQRSFVRRGKRFLAALSRSAEERYLDWISIFNEEIRGEMFVPEFRSALKAHSAKQLILKAYEHCPQRDFVTRTTCVDVLTYLPCDILKKVDIASMAYGLECRSPFLDHRVAELASAMPIELKMDARKQKKILLRTFEDFLPDRLRNRPKMGFGVPLNVWFRKELKPLLYDVLLSDRTFDRGMLDQSAVARLVEQHQSGRWDHSYRLWNLLCLELWQRMFLDSAQPPTHAPETI
jgi:asparagine synthase (glutamine-hydrolysing)